MKKLLLTSVILVPMYASAAVEWTADPNRPLKDVFKQLDKNSGNNVPTCTNNTASSSNPTVNPVGKVWKIDKPLNSRRGEYARMRDGENTVVAQPEGDSRYYAWRWRIDASPDIGSAPITVFQWKTAKSTHSDNGKQNYPINMEYANGKLRVNAFGPCLQSETSSIKPACTEYPNGRRVTLKEVSVPEGQWRKLALKIFKSDDENQGYVEFYYNGVLQTLSNGSPTGSFRVDLRNNDTRAYFRTSDGLIPPVGSTAENMYPKWGVYNSASCDHDVDIYLDDMVMGRWKSDVGL